MCTQYTHLIDHSTHYIYIVHMCWLHHTVLSLNVLVTPITRHPVNKLSCNMPLFLMYLMYGCTFPVGFYTAYHTILKATDTDWRVCCIWGSSVQNFLWSNPPTSFLWTSREPNRVRIPTKNHCFHPNPIAIFQGLGILCLTTQILLDHIQATCKHVG